MQAFREVEKSGVSGILMLLVGLGGLIGGGVMLVASLATQAELQAHHAQGDATGVLASIGAIIASFFVLSGLFTVNPNEAVVLQLFGDYVGTTKTPGLRWVNPFYKKRKLSVRVWSFDSARLKVNDKDGNPIEIGTIVVLKVRDTAAAAFSVVDYTAFVRTQAEAALRIIASRHPYDGHEGEPSLRGSPDQMANELKRELQAHVDSSGVEIVDTKISYLAYAQEIAHAMLQRQQAAAIIAARQKIVDGAVGMVQMALDRLDRDKICQLDEERKAQMVANLLVVLCSERSAQPVINSGTIYS